MFTEDDKRQRRARPARPAPLDRRQLLAALTQGGGLAALLGPAKAAADWFGRKPEPMPEHRSIFELEGDVRVNGGPADRQTRVQAGDRIEVPYGGKLIVKVGENAFILRERSVLELEGRALVVRALRLLSGALLGVFGTQEEERRLTTRTATVGIRGTALYARVQPDMTYLCTCYGETRLAARDRPGEQEIVRSQRHDAPRWILGGTGQGPAILPAPVIDHEDTELMLLEALCGREVPFMPRERRYGGPRRRRY